MDLAVRISGELAPNRVARRLAPCRSVYRWKGAVESAEEHPMLIKTTRGRYAPLEAAIRAGHPYELPEIIAVPLAAGFSAYLDWVAAETRLQDH